jgi:hypothetical protein
MALDIKSNGRGILAWNFGVTNARRAGVQGRLVRAALAQFGLQRDCISSSFKKTAPLLDLSLTYIAIPIRSIVHLQLQSAPMTR